MTLSLHNYQSIYSLWWNYLNVEYPVIGKYEQHKFYMYEGEGQRKQNEERKYLYDMERRDEKHHKCWNEKQNKYICTSIAIQKLMVLWLCYLLLDFIHTVYFMK